jgi:hypothetical protein
MSYESLQHTYRRKNGSSLWDTLAHRQDHMQKDLSHDNGSTAVSNIPQLYLMMVI